MLFIALLYHLPSVVGINAKTAPMVDRWAETLHAKDALPLLGGFLLLGILVAFSLRGGPEAAVGQIGSARPAPCYGRANRFSRSEFITSATPQGIRTLAENASNMIQGRFRDVETFMKRLDLALNYGLAVDVPLMRWQVGKPANSLSMVTAAAAHPAVLCWKILDEPQRIATRESAEVPTRTSLKSSHPINRSS